MIGVVVSRADRVSEFLGEHLLESADWTAETDDARPPERGGGTVHRRPGFAVRTFADRHLDLEGAADAFDDPAFLVFLARHAGETGRLLTAHFTGNFGAAEHGGAPGELARPCPGAARRVLRALDARAPERYDVAMECTHHGPSSVGAPSMFVELGSGPEQWDDADAARAVAGAVIDLEGASAAADRTLAVFGGGHYAPRPARIVRETDWAVGHVAADWALADLGDPGDHRDVIARALAASGASHAVVEGERPALREVLADLGYRVVGETWIQATSGVPLERVDALEAALAPVEAGLRFGDRATDPGAAEFTVVDLPDALLAECVGIDRERTRAVVAGATVAFETTDGGTAVEGRAAVAAPGDRDRLLASLTTLLAEKYDRVEWTDGAVVAAREAFDPEAARERGVSPGPAFGALARGEAVEVDGETVRPDEVRREETVRFSL